MRIADGARAGALGALLVVCTLYASAQIGGSRSAGRRADHYYIAPQASSPVPKIAAAGEAQASSTAGFQ